MTLSLLIPEHISATLERTLEKLSKKAGVPVTWLAGNTYLTLPCRFNYWRGMPRGIPDGNSALRALQQGPRAQGHVRTARTRRCLPPGRPQLSR